MKASRPSTATIVSGLARPEAYPEPPVSVRVLETHMSWVFLAGAHVYKLKKPMRQDGLDFSTPDLRRRNCLEEVRPNRRLAASVYYGVAAVTCSVDGRVAVAGPGDAVDWVVHMRRLPAERNLETVLLSGHAALEEPEIRRSARHLALFYAAAAPERVFPAGQRARLVDGVRGDLEVLMRPRYGLSPTKVQALAQSQLDTLEQCAAGFHRRVEDGRIVEGHGDLRPEHIWLGHPPAIIDCVEFDRTLRTVDPADELAFCGLECERLGAPEAGRWFLDTYVDVTGDAPPAWLLGFYRVYRALRRATIAVRHLDDPSVVDPDRFLARAHRYIEMVEPLSPQLASSPR